MKGKLYLAFLTVAAFLLIVISVPAPIIIPPAGGGGTVSGSITGAYSFNGPFSVVNATNVYLSAVLSNQVMTGISKTATNFYLTPSVLTNVVYVNATGSTARINGLLLTNLAMTAPVGSTLVLSPGEFNIGTNEVSLLRNGVNWHVPAGATISSGTAGEQDDIHSMFHDTSGAITSSITGNGIFIVSNDFGHVMELSNVNSRVYFQFKQALAANSESAIIQNTGGGQLVLDSPEGVIESYGYDAYISSVTNGPSNPNLSSIYINVKNLLGDTNAGDSAFEFAGAFRPGYAYIKADLARGDATIVDGLVAEIGVLDLGANNVIYSPLRQVGNGVLRNTYVYGTSNRTVSLIQTPNNEDGGFATAGTFDNNDFIGPTNRPIATITNDFGKTFFSDSRFYDGFGATNSIRSRNAQNVVLNNVKLDLGLHANITSAGTTNYNSVLNAARSQVTGTSTNTGASSFAGGVDIFNEDLVITGGDVYAGVGWFDTLYVTNAFALEAGAGLGKVLTSDGSGIGTWETPAAGGSGGTNFPAVLLQVGNTNYTLQAGKRTSHYMITNLNHGLDADLAAPASGHSFYSRITNSAGTNITVTFYTNGVVATYYESIDRTNSGTSFIVPAGSVVGSEFTWLGNYWIREQKEGPELRVNGDGVGIVLQTNGLFLTISNTFTRFGAGVTNTMTAAGFDNSDDMNFSTKLTNRWFIGGTPGTWGDFMPWNSNFNNIGSATIPVKQIYADEIYARSGGIVTRGLAVIPTLRTNFADGNISFPLYTHVAANWTNAVAGNRTITITAPVVGMSFSLSLVSDGSARTLSVFNVAGGTCTWLSTNDTANATNILTTASKRSLLCGRVDLGTDGNTTNLTLWVKNQTP